MDKHVETRRRRRPPYLGDDENLLHDSGVDQVSKVKDVAGVSYQAVTECALVVRVSNIPTFTNA